jgi:hypothetical protein
MTRTLLERITARRRDGAFMRRLRRIIARDPELLDRLAGK